MKYTIKILSDIEQEKWKSWSKWKVAVQEISPRSIPLQGIKSEMIIATENELKRKGKPKLLSELEQKSESQGHRKMSQFRFSSRSIPMQGIKSVLINATENELKRKG